MEHAIACPDDSTPATQYEEIPAHVKEQPSRQNEHRFLRGVRLPSDFYHVNLSSAEEPLRRLVALPDQWDEEQLGRPPAEFVAVPLSAQQHLVAERWETRRPDLHQSDWENVGGRIPQGA